jgi:hypothetical protein
VLLKRAGITALVVLAVVVLDQNNRQQQIASAGL